MNISLIWRLVQNAGQNSCLQPVPINAVVMQTEGNPGCVWGKTMVSPEAQTVLVYSHYDVMPAEPF